MLKNQVKALASRWRATCKACPGEMPNCCPKIPGWDRSATLVQCCMLFWGLFGIGNGTPLAEPHSDAHYLADDFCLRIPHYTRRHRRERVGLENHLFASHCAPAAGVAFAR